MTMTTMTTTGDDLAQVLMSLGVEVTRAGDREISGRCPVHHLTTGRADRSPSWSMNASTGLWICYSCGAKGNLPYLVTTLTGDEDAILAINLHLIQSGVERLSYRPDQKKRQPVVNFDKYRTFKRVPQRLLDLRNLDADLTHQYGVRWDPNGKCWVIPIISPIGELLGWQEKSTGYFCNVPNEVEKSSTLFGLDRFRQKTAVLLESPLDVIRLAAVRDDVQGLASFGVYVSDLQLSLLTQFADRVIIALDNDRPGRQQAEKVHRLISPPRQGLFYLKYDHTDAKDIGDMSGEEITEAITGSSFLPWWSKL
jgi:hypothetical protein